jgi:hypothetical protein
MCVGRGGAAEVAPEIDALNLTEVPRRIASEVSGVSAGGLL